MAYMVSLISIILVLFLFIDEHELRDENKIFEEKSKKEIRAILQRKKYIESNIKLIQFNEIQNLADSIWKTKEYVLLYKEGAKITKSLQTKLILNYIYRKEILSVYNGKYTFEIGKRNNKLERIKKKLYSNLLNYINIFDKQSMNSYTAILGHPKEILNYTRYEKIIYYLAEDVTISFNLDSKIERHKAFQLYISSIKNLSIKTSLKIGVFIFSTGSVTINLIRSGFNVTSDLYSFILALATYYCYIQIVGYMYKSIGKVKYVATYLFPLFIVIYFMVTIYVGIQNIKKT